MPSPFALAVVLAAGEGTRMRSQVPKVLHTVAGRPLVDHAVAAATLGGADRVAVVVGAWLMAVGLRGRPVVERVPI